MTALALLAGVVRRRIAIVTVSGESMRPTFGPGERVFVRRAAPGQLRRGQVILVERPGADGTWISPPPRWPGTTREWMIKRVAALPGDELATGRVVPPGHLFVLGDNPAVSVDSRQLGYCPADRMLGIVINQTRYHRPF